MKESAEHKLFQPLQLGPLTLKNRIVMAPLTRNRAGSGNVATDLTAQYYEQRAGAGLIVAEGSQIDPMAQGYLATPGIHSPEQIAGWRTTTDRVHAAGGRIFLQIWHVGRVSHASLLPGEAAPLAPSAVTAKAKTYLGEGFVWVSDPRALEAAEIPDIIAQYRRAAANAVLAGFDGVEIHAANGYLVDQFLKDGTNKRTDSYGGSIENRIRFATQVVQAVCDEIGPERVGVRLSPDGPINDCADSDPQPLFAALMQALDRIGPVYVHMIEGVTGLARPAGPGIDYAALRRLYRGVYLANNCYDLETAKAALDGGAADLVSFGRAFIANPDLVDRFKAGAALNDLDKKTLYGGDRRGYVDYPTLARSSGG